MRFLFCALTSIACLAVSHLAAGREATPAALTNPVQAGRLFAVEMTGEGEPMILIPGLISSGDVWRETVAHYASRYRCHVLTLAGFAGQPAADATPFLTAVRDAIALYIRQRKLERPVIVGHSLGGFLALSVASANPDLVGKLVIVDGLPAPGAEWEQSPGTSAEDLKAVAERAADSYARTDAAARRKMIATMARSPEHVAQIAAWDEASDRATAVKALKEILSSDLRLDLAKIETPALVLASAESARSQDDLERLFRSQFRHMKQWRLELAPPTTRHFVMYDEPAWLFDRMDTFLHSTK